MTHRFSAVLSAFALALASSVSMADRVHTTSGQVYEGFLVAETATEVIIRTTVAGMELDLPIERGDIRLIERSDEVATPEPMDLPEITDDPDEPEERGEPEEREGRAERAEKAERVLYAEIPLDGGIGVVGDGVAITAHGLREALELADKRRVSHVVFLIESPGGFLYEANSLMGVLREFEHRFTYITVVESGGAFSAATVFVAAADHVFCRGGASFGGATAYSTNFETGAAEVDKKLNSIWGGQLAAFAEENENPGVIFHAMVESPVEVFASESLARFAEQADGDAEDWVRVDGPETILTVRAAQAEKFGLAQMFHGESDELGEVLGIEGWKTAGPQYARLVDRAGRDREQLERRFTAARDEVDDAIANYNWAVTRYNNSAQRNRDFYGAAQSALRSVRSALNALDRLAALGRKAEREGAQHLAVDPDQGTAQYRELKQLERELLDVVR